MNLNSHKFKLALCLLLFLVLGNETKAGHIGGLELRLIHVTDSQYKVVLDMYSDCNSNNPGPTVFAISIKKGGIPLYLTGQAPVFNHCGVDSLCPSANQYQAFIHRRYVGRTTISTWDSIFFESCCISPSILNLSSQGFIHGYVSAYVDVSNGHNTNPFSSIGLDQLLFAYDSMDVNLSLSDIDGDSVYLTTYDDSNINYRPGFSAANPTGHYFNISNGKDTNRINYRCTNTGSYALNFQIVESRNGTVNAWHRIYMQANNLEEFRTDPPRIKATGFQKNIDTAYVGYPEKYILTPSNLKLNKSPKFYYINLPAGMSALSTSNPGDPQVLTWIPSASQANLGWVNFQLRLGDTSCNHNTYDYWVYISDEIPPASDFVWPADADHSHSVTILDPIQVGLAYGKTGLDRPGATSLWQAEYSQNWDSEFLNGVNHKHADCNGDGIIDSLDLVVIQDNFALSHAPSRDSSWQNIQSLGNNLQLSSSIDSLTGDRQIHFGLTSSTSPLEDLYAISMDMEYDSYTHPGQTWIYENKSLSNSNSVMFASSFLPFYVHRGQNKIALALSRTDQQNASPNGRLFTLSTKDYGIASIKLNNIRFYKNDEVTLYTLGDTTIYIYPLSTTLPSTRTPIILYPNPSQGRLSIRGIDVEEMLFIRLFDLLGREVGQIQEVAADMQLPPLQTGLYFFDIQTVQGQRIRLPLEITQ